MPNLPARFASAIFVTAIASSSFAILPQSVAVAAVDCLAAPNGPTPAGSHWRYHIDHVTQQHCWYLRQEGEKASQTAPPSAAVRAEPVAQAATPSSPADAHAELPPQATLGRLNGNDKPTPTLPANAADIPGAADTVDANAPLSSVATPRWLDPTPLSSAATTQPAANEPDAGAQSGDAAALAPPPTAPVAVPLAAADSSVQGRPVPIPKLLGVIAGALAFAGLIVSIVFGSARWSRRRQIRKGRGAIWDSADDRVVRSVRLRAKVAPRRPAPVIARDLDRLQDPSERIERFVSRPSRRAAT